MFFSSIANSEHVQLVLVIVTIGVGIRTWSGMIGKKITELNINRVLFTYVISTIVAIPLITPTVQEISKTATPELWFTVIVSAVLTIYGSDALGKTTIKHVMPKKYKTYDGTIESIVDDTDLIPKEDIESVPPGK